MSPPDAQCGTAPALLPQAEADAGERGLSPALTLVFAIACGATVANLYYAQPLVGLIGPALGLRPELAGLVMTLTQLGYGAGLLFITPLGDLIENRRLIVLTLSGTVVGLAGVAMAHSAAMYLAATFVVGVCATAAQVLVPFSAHLAPDARRGRVVGNVMSGLLAGIMLARPASSFIADHLGWRAVFWISAAAMLALIVVLRLALPRRQPRGGLHYGQVLLTTVRLPIVLPVVRRRAAYQALAFAAFNLFWTAVPLLLTARFGFTQRGIALFALAGAGGALAAPIAGRIADRGWTQVATAAALGVVTLAFPLAGWAAGAGMVVVLALAAVVLDAGVQTNQVIGQRTLYALAAELRARLNAAYMTILFMGGAAGSVLASITFEAGGWRLTVLTGAGMGVAVLLLFATEYLGGDDSPARLRGRGRR